MFTKQEASKQRQAFWTTFGQYMQPIVSAEGIKTNWINYKTGVAGIYFKMDVDNNQANISITLNQSDEALRTAQYSQLLQLKTMLHNTLGEEWNWQPNIQDDHGKIISRVSTNLSPVSIFKHEDWPALISFFKQRIVALDAFWSVAKYGFEV